MPCNLRIGQKSQITALRTLRDLASLQLVYCLPVALFMWRRFTVWSKQPAAETATRSRCSVRCWTVSLHTLYLHRYIYNVIGNFCFQKSAANSNEFPDPSALYLLQDRGVCALAAQRKLDAVLLLQGHRWGSAWSLLARIDLQRWLIMRVWFDVAEHPLLSQGWWRSLLLSQLSALMDELSTSLLRCCLPTYLILHPEMLQPLVGMLITLHALWLG